nr:hypothetical protein [uncultured Prevotella sp.]
MILFNVFNMWVDGCSTIAELIGVWWSEVVVRCQSAHHTAYIILYIKHLRPIW